MCYMDQSLTVIFIPACFRLSLSLSAAEPPLPLPTLHSTPPPIRRTAHPISHLLCWFFAARETFPNTNRAYGVYRLFTRHNARLSPLFRCITGFNYTKQGPERSHHGLWTRLGDIDMRYQGLLYGRRESVANPTPVYIRSVMQSTKYCY